MSTHPTLSTRPGSWYPKDGRSAKGRHQPGAGTGIVQRRVAEPLVNRLTFVTEASTRGENGQEPPYTELRTTSARGTVANCLRIVTLAGLIGSYAIAGAQSQPY